MRFKFIILMVILLVGVMAFFKSHDHKLPLIAIANYGPHASLESSIKGIKDELARCGYKDKENVNIEVTDVDFDLSLIPQMINNLKSKHPRVVVVVGTPIAQYAKKAITDIPVVFSVVTDPVEGGLLKEAHEPDANMTGASDKQDVEILLQFSKKLIPEASKVGVLFATSEVNDIALVKMLKEAAGKNNMEVVAVPVIEARDVVLNMQAFQGKVDFIYVGASGAIQPTLPAIVTQADKMKIPLFNVFEQAVLDHQVLASFGVNYYQVGINAAHLIERILKGEAVSTIKPIYPTLDTHHGFISLIQATKYHINIPKDVNQVTLVE